MLKPGLALRRRSKVWSFPDQNAGRRVTGMGGYGLGDRRTGIGRPRRAAVRSKWFWLIVAGGVALIAAVNLPIVVHEAGRKARNRAEGERLVEAVYRYRADRGRWP